MSCSNCVSGGITTSFAYEPTFNRLASVVDPLGRTWTLNYDNLGNLTSIVDPLTHQITLGHNSQGRVTSIADALNDTWQLAYGYYGDLSQLTDPLATQSSCNRQRRSVGLALRRAGEFDRCNLRQPRPHYADPRRAQRRHVFQLRRQRQSVERDRCQRQPDLVHLRFAQSDDQPSRRIENIGKLRL